VRDEVPVYGSGGFTSLSPDDLRAQLEDFVADGGMTKVKMKIGTGWGTDVAADLARVRLVREALGDTIELFTDANGAYDRKQAVRVARSLDELGVSWFEEPVSSDDLDGLRRIAAMTVLDVAAGEYGSDLAYFERMAPHVDVLQADVSRCAGITEWRRVAAVAAAHGLRISGHCAQSLHAPVAASAPNLAHLEYFADHAMVDRLLFDGVLDPVDGVLRLDLSTPGHGLTLKGTDAERYRVS
jgi:L-alanine-DL-glutamate epimerase-like enolase superfamily enzyme